MDHNPAPRLIRVLMPLLLGLGALAAPHAHAQEGALRRAVNAPAALGAPAAPAADREAAEKPAGVLPLALQPEKLVEPQSLSSTLNLMVLMTVLSLAPSALIMTTCFVRFIVIFGLLRQALGTQTLPPNQVLVSMSLFLTMLVMTPTWKQSYELGLRPYIEAKPGREVDLQTAFKRAAQPIRAHMSGQIERAGNSDAVWMLIDYQRSAGDANEPLPQSYDEIGLEVLLPAYMLSELKTAFLIGFQIFLPFLVIDMVVAAVLMSMGMAMLPPTVVSLPFKLLLFVMIDGWTLTVGMMLTSVRV